MSEDVKGPEPGEKADSESRRKLVAGALAAAPLIISYKARGQAQVPSGPCYDSFGNEKACSVDE